MYEPDPTNSSQPTRTCGGQDFGPWSMKHVYRGERKTTNKDFEKKFYKLLHV